MSAGAGDNGGAMMAGGIGQLAEGDETDLSKHTNARTECPRQPPPTHTLIDTLTQKHRRAGGQKDGAVYSQRNGNIYFSGCDSTIASINCEV